jgi:hypothetical protein
MIRCYLKENDGCNYNGFRKENQIEMYTKEKTAGEPAAFPVELRYMIKN